MRVDDSNAGVQLIEVVLQRSTSQQNPLLAFEGLYLLDELALLVLQAMSLVKDEEIALLAQGLTVLVEVFVADDQESIVVIDEIFYYFCDLIA